MIKFELLTKLKFWEICTYHYELDRIPILKDASIEIDKDISNCDFLIVYKEMC